MPKAKVSERRNLRLPLVLRVSPLAKDALTSRQLEHLDCQPTRGYARYNILSVVTAWRRLRTPRHALTCSNGVASNAGKLDQGGVASQGVLLRVASQGVLLRPITHHAGKLDQGGVASQGVLLRVASQGVLLRPITHHAGKLDQGGVASQGCCCARGDQESSPQRAAQNTSALNCLMNKVSALFFTRAVLFCLPPAAQLRLAPLTT